MENETNNKETKQKSKYNSEWISKALERLKKYKEARDPYETRMLAAEKWYKMRNWDNLTSESIHDKDPKSVSAWAFNSMANKHADFMDNYPVPAVLPREQSDEGTATILASVVPVILEQNKFEKIYSEASWDKIVRGTSVYGIFWNSDKENGLGDIDLRAIDVLSLYWEPGISDIQESNMLFHVNIVDRKAILKQYPQAEGHLGGIEEFKIDYDTNENLEIDEKTTIYDCYFKEKIVKMVDNIPITKTVLRYVKFTEGIVLYASEDDEKDNNKESWYEHGQYPYIFDVMFPVKASPVGFGFVDIMANPQEYIDKLDTVLLDSSRKSKTRYFANRSINLSLDDFANLEKDIIPVDGQVDETSLRQVKVAEVPTFLRELRQAKIDELKETSSNRDFSQGSTASGVTAASAIAALQEAGSKTSRDMIRNTYTAYGEIVTIVIELIREFYKIARTYRVSAPNESFQEIDSEMLNPTVDGIYSRKPIFDIKVSAQKSSPYSRIANNELAKELYQMGIFQPENSAQALAVLKIMDFDRKEEVVKIVSQNGSMQDQINRMQQQMVQMAQIIADQTGRTDLVEAVASPITQGQPGQLPKKEKTAGEKQREGAREIATVQ